MAEEISQQGVLLEFTDNLCGKFWLTPKALHHIKHDNLIEDPQSFINQVFRGTIAIVESKWKSETYIYYSPLGKLYGSVVANTIDRRIKTAFISKEIKGGGVIWISPNLMT